MPAVDVLRRKRAFGYDDSRDAETQDTARTLSIDPTEKRDFAGMGYKPGDPVNLTVQGTWDGEKVSVDSVTCNPPEPAVPQGPPTPQGDPIVRMNPAPMPG